MHARHYPRGFAVVAGIVAALLLIGGVILMLTMGS